MPPVGCRQRVKDALPGTYANVVEKAHVTKSTAKRWIRDLMASGECHIKKWIRSPNQGHFQPVFVPGPGKNAVCKLKAMTVAEYSRRYRKRHKDDEKGDRMRQTGQMRYFARKARQEGDSMVLALFGMNTRG